MSEPRDSETTEIVELDFTPSTFDLPPGVFAVGVSRVDIQRILDEQMIEYELADDYVPPYDRRLSVPARDISPSWEILRDHYAKIAEPETENDACTAPGQSEVDDGSRFRLYPVRPKGQKDVAPLTVVISLRDRRVIALG